MLATRWTPVPVDFGSALKQPASLGSLSPLLCAHEEQDHRLGRMKGGGSRPTVTVPSYPDPAFFQLGPQAPGGTGLLPSAVPRPLS